MTALPSWDKAYETGDSAIDAQHRHILALVEDLRQVDLASDEREAFRVLDAVMEFTFDHFDMEEELMPRVNYPLPDQIEMTEQHREFRSSARLRVLEFRFQGAEAMEGYPSHLREWLVNHEFGMDRKLARFIQDTGQSVSAHAASAEASGS